jgi:hypothetical protein
MVSWQLQDAKASFREFLYVALERTANRDAARRGNGGSRSHRRLALAPTCGTSRIERDPSRLLGTNLATTGAAGD